MTGSRSHVCRGPVLLCTCNSFQRPEVFRKGRAAKTLSQQLQAQAPQPAQYPSANLPQTYSVTSSFVRDMPTVDIGTLTAQQQGDPSSYPLNPFLGTRQLSDSQELTEPHSEGRAPSHSSSSCAAPCISSCGLHTARG